RVATATRITLRLLRRRRSADRERPERNLERRRNRARRRDAGREARNGHLRRNRWEGREVRREAWNGPLRRNGREGRDGKRREVEVRCGEVRCSNARRLSPRGVETGEASRHPAQEPSERALRRAAFVLHVRTRVRVRGVSLRGAHKAPHT